MDPIEVQVQAEVTKIDDELGIVFGWGIITHKQGGEYVDLQDDHVTEKCLLESTVEYMQHCNVLKEMHQGGQVGEVIFGFPLTDDIAKAFGIECELRGFMMGVKPDAPTLAKFKSGELTGFSLGGTVTEYADNVEYTHAA